MQDASSHEKEQAPRGDLRRGLSVSYLCDPFVNHLHITSNEKVYDIEPRIRAACSHVHCPRDGEPGAAYVDVAEDDDAGAANLMLSYSWGYTVADIVASLDWYCKKSEMQPTCARVWICCLCVNQFRVQDMLSKGEKISFGEFQQTFGDRVKEINHVIALFSPWEEPLYLSRVWCIYEAFVADSVGATFEVIMPPAQATSLYEVFESGDILPLWSALAAVDVDRAQASFEDDKVMIMDLIRQGPGSRILNRTVGKQLRVAVVDLAESHLRHLFRKASSRNGDAIALDSSSLVRKLANRVADWLCYFGEFSRASSLLHEALQLSDASTTTSQLLSTMGWAQYNLEDFAGAKMSFDAAFELQVADGTEVSPDGSLLCANMGLVLESEGRLEAAIEAYLKALSLHDQAGSSDSPEAAGVWATIGTARSKQNNFDGAFQSFAEAWSRYEVLGRPQTPNAAAVQRRRAEAYLLNGQPTAAIKELEDAWERVYEPLQLTDSWCAAAALSLWGQAQEAVGDQDAALLSYQRALAAFAATAGSGSKAAKNVQRFADRLLGGRVPSSS